MRPQKLLFNDAMTLYEELVKDGTQKVFSHNDLHQKIYSGITNIIS